MNVTHLLTRIFHSVHESATRCLRKAKAPLPYPLPNPLYVVPFRGLGRGIKGEGHFAYEICGIELLLLFLALASHARAAHWPQFRGPGGMAVAADANPPVHFHPNSNAWWKAELPPGHSSPCVWGDSIFLTAQSGQKLETLCLDARSGSVRWRRVAPA